MVRGIKILDTSQIYLFANNNDFCCKYRSRQQNVRIYECGTYIRAHFCNVCLCVHTLYYFLDAVRALKDAFSLIVADSLTLNCLFVALYVCILMEVIAKRLSTLKRVCRVSDAKN